MAATSTGMTRLESFPFDSKADGYDADGYPIYDRAVGASMLRDTFAKFFTNGIFPSPGTALNIGKASTGLAVAIQPGIGIIKGSMGGVTGDDPLTVTLDAAPPQGNVCYGIMLRYDNTDGFADSRSLLINVVRGDASSSPTPPTPDTTTPEVYELRLGYVTVPSGATDLSEATVTNEKGLAVCPYAAPFEEIDLSQIVADAQSRAQEATDAFIVYAQKYYDLVASALDGTTAGELQAQIDAITPAGLVDNATLGQSSAGKMQVKDSGISTAKIQDGAVTKDKLENYFSFITDPSTSGTFLMGGQTPTWGRLSSAMSFTELWSGTWGTGNISKPSGMDSYSLLIVETSGKDITNGMVLVFGYTNSSGDKMWFGCGCGGYGEASLGTAGIVSVCFTDDNGTLTPTYGRNNKKNLAPAVCTTTFTDGSGQYFTVLNDATITRIIGVM